jgi:methylated-DNA-[protein]-cysteine S-methyltransferase
VKRLQRQAARALAAYFRGAAAGLQALPVDFSGYSPFERRVLQRLRRVGPGACLTYGDLARRAGRSPRAARAVGGVMRKNRLPIIVPCHRVLAAGGKLGGYSPGKAWKRRLLSLEGAAVL